MIAGGKKQQMDEWMYGLIYGHGGWMNQSMNGQFNGFMEE